MRIRTSHIEILFKEANTMKRILPLMVIAAAVATFGQAPVLAKPGGNTAAPGASPSPSSHAIANSNGRNATDRDFGRDRAEDRTSAQGKAHSNASHLKKSKKLASAKTLKPRATPATPATPAVPPANGRV